jgi:hypothetical protein
MEQAREKNLKTPPDPGKENRNYVPVVKPSPVQRTSMAAVDGVGEDGFEVNRYLYLKG